MFQGQVIRSAAPAELPRDADAPRPLARGLAFGLPLSLGLWTALAVLIF